MNILILDLTTLLNKSRKQVKNFGKETILKNKYPDSVLLPIAKNERPSKVFEKSNNIKKIDIANFIKRLPSAGNREVYTLDQLKQDLYLSNDL